MKCHSVAILAVAFYLAGCGVNTPSSSNPTPVHTGITGNWELTATSTQAPYAGEYATYGVYLTQTGSTVSGIIGNQEAFPLCISPLGPPCAFPFGVIDLELVGTVDAKGNMVLNTVPYTGGGGALSIAASTTTDDAAFSGNYTITLVTTSPAGTWTDQGTISGNTISTLNGTYSGTLKSLDTGNSIGITTTLSQTSSPDSAGELEVSGSANFTGTPCFSSATTPNPGGLLGNQLVIDFVPTNSPTTTIILSGTLSQDTKTITVDYSVHNVNYSVNNVCGSDYGSGTLTLQ
jgi:hypothetical protein